MLGINLTIEVITLIMFISVIMPIILGLPIAFSLAGVSMVLGVGFLGTNVIQLFTSNVFNVNMTYGFLAIPLFIFMGNMIEKTGITRRMFDALYVWMGNIKGGLAIITIIVGTILAACVGIIAASVIMLTLIGVPVMLEKGYDKKLITGSVTAGGSLGILIPPSIMIVMYGPAASISVGKLFMGAFTPGLLLSALYILYIVIRCRINPNLAPAISTQNKLPINKKIIMLSKSLLPPVFLIISVLGSIMFGIASPTEAAAIGAFASVLLAAFYRTLSFQNVKDSLIATISTTSMAMGVAYGAKMFTVLFIRLGCGNVIENAILGLPGGKWVSFLVIMLIIFILGMFIDWLGILFIMVPIMTPLGAKLGFDAIWFAMMVIINLQLSFITPPFAYAIFYCKGVLDPKWNISTNDIILGIIPYVFLIIIALFLCILFPNIIMWLPNRVF